MAPFPHYFIGIPLPAEIKQELSEWQLYLKRDLEANYQIWTHKEDLHLTLKFLGETEQNQIPTLQKKLAGLQEESSFQITVGGIGTFGKPRKPRVLWSGVEINQSLSQLKKRVEETSMQTGFLEDNQPYRPHITLAKKWKGEKLSKEKLNQYTEKLQRRMVVTVTSISLFRIYPSKLPKYEEVSKIELK